MNIINLALDDGLRDHKLGAGEYFLLMEAPALANVTLKANAQFGNGFPIKVGYSARSKNDVDQWYISADAVAGGVLKIVMSDSNDPFVIDIVPSSIDVETIGEITAFSAALLSNLDKIINPYTASTTVSVSSNSTTTVTLLSVTCDFDKIDLFLNSGLLTAGTSAGLYISLGGDTVYRSNRNSIATYAGENSTYTEKITLENCNGKTLIITGLNTSGNYFLAAYTKYTLKP